MDIYGICYEMKQDLIFNKWEKTTRNVHFESDWILLNVRLDSFFTTIRRVEIKHHFFV